LFSDDCAKLVIAAVEMNTEGFEIMTGYHINPSVTLVLWFKLLPKTESFFKA